MAHAHATQMSARYGAAVPTSRRRSQVARRRRILVVVMVLVLLTLGALANYGPLQSYLDARARLETANAAMEQLAAQKAELQAELGRLSQADYLESLARQNLSYTRPGEELFIVTGLDDTPPTAGPGGAATSEGTAAARGASTGQVGTPGFLERSLTPILD